MSPLVEAALATPSQRYRQRTEVGEGEIELALAWASGVVTLKQAAVAMGSTRSMSYAVQQLAYGLRAAIKRGKLVQR